MHSTFSMGCPARRDIIKAKRENMFNPVNDYVVTKTTVQQAKATSNNPVEISRTISCILLAMMKAHATPGTFAKSVN
jgi:hypothetical protein